MKQEKNIEDFPKTEIINGKEVIKDIFVLNSGDTMEILSDPESGKIFKKTIHTALGDFTTNQEAIDNLAKELNFKPDEVEAMIDDMLKDLYIGKIDEKGKIPPSKDTDEGTMSFFKRPTD